MPAPAPRIACTSNLRRSVTSADRGCAIEIRASVSETILFSAASAQSSLSAKWASKLSLDTPARVSTASSVVSP
jgi:hypothetical protein